MAVGIWLTIEGNDAKDEFIESFLEHNEEIKNKNWDISYITVVPVQQFASITIYNEELDEDKEIKLVFIEVVEWLLCNHQWCDEWTL